MRANNTPVVPCICSATTSLSVLFAFSKKYKVYMASVEMFTSVKVSLVRELSAHGSALYVIFMVIVTGVFPTSIISLNPYT